VTAAPWHLVLLAGGRGTRFWPASRTARPKQFLKIDGGTSLLRRTWERYHAPPAGGPARTLVVAPAEYHEAIRRELPGLPPADLIAEPSARDTAPAVGLACLEARRGDPRALVVVSPTDHRVAEPAAFGAALAAARTRAGAGGLGTLGVRPDRAATEFGYLKLAGPPAGRTPAAVERFLEKPDRDAAQRLIAGGDVLWNAGIFVFRADVFFAEAARVAPALASGLDAFDRARASGDTAGAREAWDALPALSLDYSLMEKAGDVWTVPLDAGWDDLGGWDAAARLLPADADGNATETPDSLFVDARRCAVFGGPGDATAGPGEPLTVLVGVEDLVVVRTADVTLVARRDRAAEVKQVLDRLRALGREDLL